MQTIANRVIDLSNYTPEDLEFCYPRGAQLSINFESSTTLSVQGHNVLSDTFYTLPIVEKMSYDVITEIKKAGMYDIDISSVDMVKLIVEGKKGKIYVKVTGK